MTQFSDLMIDLETLGTAPGSVITQIGLCAFNPRGSSSAAVREIQHELIHVNPQSCLDLGMTVSWSTIQWWLQQDEAARMTMARPAVFCGLPDALEQLDQFIIRSMAMGFFVWGNGSGFDVTLIEVAYRACNRAVPWSYRNVRDQRTLVKLAPCAALQFPKPDVAHDARADAIAQAEAVSLCIAAIERPRLTEADSQQPLRSPETNLT